MPAKTRDPTYLHFKCKCGRTYDSPLPALDVQCSGAEGRKHPWRLMAPVKEKP